MHLTDWYVTFAALAGATAPTADARAEAKGLPPVDALDMWPMLSGANARPKQGCSDRALSTSLAWRQAPRLMAHGCQRLWPADCIGPPSARPNQPRPRHPRRSLRAGANATSPRAELPLSGNGEATNLKGTALIVSCPASAACHGSEGRFKLVRGSMANGAWAGASRANARPPARRDGSAAPAVEVPTRGSLPLPPRQGPPRPTARRTRSSPTAAAAASSTSTRTPPSTSTSPRTSPRCCSTCAAAPPRRPLPGAAPRLRRLLL